VLIADDEPEILELLQEILAAHGYEVRTAIEGSEALAAMPAFRPDVLILDIGMPNLSGTEVLEELRRSGSTVPVIAISGHYAATGEAFFSVVPKPFSVKTIVQTVAAAVGHGEVSNG
jgi:two-component system KDP operon response regulator KdpE